MRLLVNRVDEENAERPPQGTRRVRRAGRFPRRETINEVAEGPNSEIQRDSPLAAPSASDRAPRSSRTGQIEAPSIRDGRPMRR